jgi:spermidine dehydrogenase
MYRAITRRDFVNGVAVSLGASALAASPLAAFVTPPTGRRGARQNATHQDASYAPERDPAYYPPGRTGLRGAHPGSYEVAHQMRDGHLGAVLDAARPSGEHFDLIVVGAGISGLAAAWYYRQAHGPSARILILDNHDDFGGHAKRNEFAVGASRPRLGYGGTQSIDGPQDYSHVARALLTDLGIDLRRFYSAFDRGFYSSRGMHQGVFFDRETFGRDHLATGAGADPWATVLAGAPLDEAVRRDVIRVYESDTDYLAGRSRARKLDHLARTSYRDYLLHDVHVAPAAIPVFQALTHDLWGVGIDAVPAADLRDSGFRGGFQGLGLDDVAPPRGPLRATPPEGVAPYIFHFPDGNASIARLLVRSLVPGAVPGHTMEDVVDARVNYAALDAGGPVSLRLNSTVARVGHVGANGRPTSNASGDAVDVTYVRGGKAWIARADHVVMACWNGVIPYLCPELPDRQKAALSYGSKVPLVYTNVAFHRWTAFDRHKISSIYSPSSYHSLTDLDYPVSLGDYAFARGPDDPIVAHMLRTPCVPGLPSRDQHRAGRAELLATSFETFERNIRDQLARMLGDAFDPARDIAAITVNRWPHGYAYEYNTLWDAAAWPGAERPCVVGRQPFGRITIANSDAGAKAYTNCAIDQAHRAVRELAAHPSTVGRPAAGRAAAPQPA